MIRNIFANHGITITEDQEQKLNQYYDQQKNEAEIDGCLSY